MDKVILEMTENEVLTVIDWFNGYVSKYYGYDSAIEEQLPDFHRKLIDKILLRHEEGFEQKEEEK